MKVKPYFVLVLGCLCIACGTSVTAQEATREWTDATGRFKITGVLQEVRDGNAFIKNTEGKTLKVPVNRLSQPDQDYLQAGGSPFEMVEESASSSSGAPKVASGEASGDLWAGAVKVNWDDAELVVTMPGVQWKGATASGDLGFEPRPAPLLRKANFFEGIKAVAVNPSSKRGVVGFTVTFSVPKPLTRLSLVDLASGKSVHADQVEANMSPLAVLDDGRSVVMVGAGDERSATEKKDQLQIWRFDGKAILRSGAWIPYEHDKDGGRKNAEVVRAEVVGANRLLTLSDKGHVALWDIALRKPLWHGRLSERNFAISLSADRTRLAVFDEKVLMVLNPETAEILGSIALPAGTNTGWVRLAWSPSGKRLLLTSIADIRVLDCETGQWLYEFSLPGGPVAANALSYPHEEYAWLDSRLLVHLPTKIQLCEYRDAGAVVTLGGVSFVGIHSDAGGMLMPLQIPHPAAEAMLTQAQQDPSLFLIHPGVGVAIDVAAIDGTYRQEAEQGLQQAATASGYKVDPSSPIKIVGTISGPEQEAVSYIAAGSYIVNKYTSTINLRWNSQDLWKTSGTNVPGVLMTKQGQTMQEALNDAGKKPNLSIFANARFPAFMQKPSETKASGGQSNALMVSKFSLQGIEAVP